MKKIIYITLLSFILSGCASGSTFYVKTGGNDNLDGLSDANAWETVAKVNGETFDPLDIIKFNKGDTWAERIIFPSSGTSGNVVTIGSYGTGNNPIIHGFEVTSKSFITVEYVKLIPGSSWNAMEVNGSDTIVLLYSELDGEGGNKSGYTTNHDTTDRCDNLSIIGSIIHDFGDPDNWTVGGGINLNDNVHNCIVEYNTVYDNIETNVQMFSKDVNYTSTGHIIRYNTIYNTLPFHADYETGINFGWRSQDSMAYGNFIENCRIPIQTDSATQDIDIFSNILKNGEDELIRILAGVDGDNIRTSILNNTFIQTNGEDKIIDLSAADHANITGAIIKNNLLYIDFTNYRQWFTTYKEFGDSTIEFTIDYNCYYHTDTPTTDGYFNLGGTPYTFAEWQAAGYDANSINADPLMGSNYTLNVGSPCIGTGEVLSDVTIDYRGASRGTVNDMGAYAYATILFDCVIKDCIIN